MTLKKIREKGESPNLYKRKGMIKEFPQETIRVEDIHLLIAENQATRKGLAMLQKELILVRGLLQNNQRFKFPL